MYITTRVTSVGKSYHVKYRLTGRYGRIEHAGAFPSKREAELRARTVRDWIAQAKDPRAELARFLDPSATIAEVGERWLRSRRSIAYSTVKEYERRVERLAADIDVEVSRLTYRDVDEWVAEASRTLSPGTVRLYVSTLRALLDHAGVEPNPARDRRLELPRREQRVVRPPDADRTLAAIVHANARYRPVLVLMEQTGLRVSEACAVKPRDFDKAAHRLLVPITKTKRPRWVPVAPWLVDALPPIVVANRQTVHNALKAACRAAKVDPFGPHALRHRRASLWHLKGVPVVQAAEWLGHSPAEHLKTYAHVMPVAEIPAHRLASVLR